MRCGQTSDDGEGGCTPVPYTLKAGVSVSGRTAESKLLTLFYIKWYGGGFISIKLYSLSRSFFLFLYLVLS